MIIMFGDFLKQTFSFGVNWRHSSLVVVWTTVYTLVTLVCSLMLWMCGVVVKHFLSLLPVLVWITPITVKSYSAVIVDSFTQGCKLWFKKWRRGTKWGKCFWLLLQCITIHLFFSFKKNNKLGIQKRYLNFFIV